MYLCGNRENFTPVYTFDGCEIAIDPEFSCKGYKPKEKEGEG
jgi:hypothetical protein